MSLSQSLLCESPLQGVACGTCPACHWFSQQSHPDFRLVGLAQDADEEGSDASGEGADGKDATVNESTTARKTKRKPTQISIEAIRNLADFATLGAHRGKRRVVMIEPLEALNAFAANALLKTLEEPTPGLVFLLVARSAQGVLPTLRSRCQILALAPISTPEALAWLEPTGQAQALLEASGGAPVHAHALVDPELLAIHRLTLEAIAALPDTDIVDSAQALQAAEPPRVLLTLQRWTEDLARVALHQSPRYFEKHQTRLLQLAKRTNLLALGDFSANLAQETRLANHPLNWRLFCEQTLQAYSAIFANKPMQNKK